MPSHPSSISLYMRCWPSPKQARAAVLLLHGMESHSGWFESLAADLTAARLAVVAYDRKGWGQSQGCKGGLTSPKTALDELEAVANPIWQSFEQVHLVGLSWGGLLALYQEAERPGRFRSITALVPAVYPRRRLRTMDTVRTALGLLTNRQLFIDLPIAVEDFTAKTDKQDFIRSDEWRTRAVTPQFLSSTLLMQTRVRRGFISQTQVQVLLAEQDNLIDNQATAALARNFQWQVSTIRGARHSLVFEDPAAVAAAVIASAGSINAF